MKLIDLLRTLIVDKRSRTCRSRFFFEHRQIIEKSCLPYSCARAVRVVHRHFCAIHDCSIVQNIKRSISFWFFPPHALCCCHRNSLPRPYRPEREVAVTEETSPFAPSFRRRRNGRDFGYVDYRNAGIVNVPVYRILIWMRLHDLLLD